MLSPAEGAAVEDEEEAEVVGVWAEEAAGVIAPAAEGEVIGPAEAHGHLLLQGL
jgi:hypothetical protein